MCDIPDLAVVQCQVGADNGYYVTYAYAEGYVNVLERTTINHNQSNLRDVVWQANVAVEFSVAYLNDASTDVTVLWYFRENQILPGNDERLIISADGRSLLINMTGEVDGGRHRCGSYRCVVTNKYSTDEKVVSLKYEEIVPPPRTASLWWISLIVVGVLLLLLLLLFLLFCCGCIECCACWLRYCACCVCWLRCSPCCWFCADKKEVYSVEEKEQMRAYNSSRQLRSVDISGFASSNQQTNGDISNIKNNIHSSSNNNSFSSSYNGQVNLGHTEGNTHNVMTSDDNIHRNSYQRESISNINNTDINQATTSTTKQSNKISMIDGCSVAYNYKYDHYVHPTLHETNSTNLNYQKKTDYNDNSNDEPILRPLLRASGHENLNSLSGASFTRRISSVRGSSSYERKKFEIVDVPDDGDDYYDDDDDAAGSCGAGGGASGLQRNYSNRVKSSRYVHESYSEI
ncbi:hypothetical protein HELRODRAFT_192033 [Helobdella robusta]|uniref:Ig-like domain-containing protein n=1 Tax=Helobdella robusta TaxID=6412 RepID=T1FTI9_HELRO|nr:hypothetical protein HELRODRAFT_192033 [Helobdella robusta]ESO03425.1 hypothetical protein HELRODRAFT_192033 [Helobdella robusta]